MTNGELLRRLFRSYVKSDERAFAAVAEEIVREERLKNHRLLADDLERILRQASPGASAGFRRNFPEIPKDGDRGFPLFTVESYDYSWDRLIATPKTEQTLQQITLEYQRSELLAGAGLAPRRKILFFGPPGCGKTLASKVIASELKRPVITVRFDAVVSSLLGETAANLRRIFDYISNDRWVVLFDEFDAIGKERDNQYEHGELKRVVNSLLQLMDSYRGDSLLIAATNHHNLLDSAIWRRFDSIVEFRLPSLQDRTLMLRMFLRGVDTSNIDLSRLARQLRGASGADVERVAIEATRRALVDGRRAILPEDLTIALNEFRDRLRIIGAHTTMVKSQEQTKDDMSAVDPESMD